jgi:peptidoglycan/xylan/chitin deacetylase (PgdA/CDA1 family)
VSNYPVVLFHSIDDRELLSLKDLGNIRPELFERLIRELRKEFDIVRLDELLGFISGEVRPKDRLLALTFDDGPKSYATYALPVMQTYGVPSTCFLITGCVDDKALYWRYLYNFCINKGYQQELAAFINDEYKTNIRADEIVTFSRDHYDRTKNLCIIDKLLEKVIPEKVYRNQEKDLFLSMEDIEKLKQNPLVKFGIHTQSHPVLKCLTDEEIHYEIAGSRDFYRDWIGDDAPMLSIPFGRLFSDYDERVLTIAQSLSVDVILSAYGGSNTEGQPLYNIRRISVDEGKLERGVDHFIRSLLEPALPEAYIEKEKQLSGLLSLSR